MDINTATLLLTNTENIKYFKDQCKHFQRESTSLLTDYFETINADAVAWLRSLPKGVKSKSSFYKYITPLYSLLVNIDVIKACGENLCTSLHTTIKRVFKDNVDRIINERKQHDNAPEKYTDDDEENSIDLDILEVVDVTYDTEEHNDLAYTTPNSSSQTLQQKYDDLFKEYIRLKALYERAEIELSRVWDLVNKIVSK
jgi:hypothetical protein